MKLTHPIDAWKNSRMICGPGKQTPYHFHTERGEEVIKELFIDTYRKAEILYESLDRHCKVYTDLKREKTALASIEDEELKDRIASKLTTWFFDCMFSHSVTGLGANFREEDIITAILEERIKLNRE